MGLFQSFFTCPFFYFNYYISFKFFPTRRQLTSPMKRTWRLRGGKVVELKVVYESLRRIRLILVHRIWVGGSFGPLVYSECIRMLVSSHVNLWMYVCY